MPPSGSEAREPAEPLRFRPILKEKVWGGRRLESLLGRNLPGPGPYGESWDIADFGADRSVVEGGPWHGRDLRSLVAEFPLAILGRRGAGFPLLVKTIDASEALSVQLHPGAEDALQPETKPKTEAWLILDAEPGARIVYGLADGKQRDDLFRAAAAGDAADVERHLGWHGVCAGDLVFLPAGTIHAIGGGILLLEVQESSDTTYRIYDWNRLGLDGSPRELHLREAAAVRARPEGLACPYARLGRVAGRAGEDPLVPLLRSTAFRIDALRLANGARWAGTTSLAGRPGFVIVAGVEGRARVCGQSSEQAVERGGSVLMPAAAGSFEIRAAAGGFAGLVVREGDAGG